MKGKSLLWVLPVCLLLLNSCSKDDSTSVDTGVSVEEPDSGEESYRTAPRIYYDTSTNTMQLTTDPSNPGLYFKFGSVIGIDAGTNNLASGVSGKPYSSADIRFNPTSLSTDMLSSWDNISCYVESDFSNNLLDVSAPAYHNVIYLQSGKGDPCKLLGYTADQVRSLLASGQVPDSGWRLPTGVENDRDYTKANIGINNHYSTDSDWDDGTNNGSNSFISVSGCFFPQDSGTTPHNDASANSSRTYLPAAGYRDSSDGTVYGQGSLGIYWSSTVYDSDYGRILYFSRAHVRPQEYTYYADGLSVRCVQ